MVYEFVDKLTEEQKKEIKEIMMKRDIVEYIDCFIRFWSKDEVQIDGTISINELKCIAEIMEYLQKEFKS